LQHTGYGAAPETPSNAFAWFTTANSLRPKTVLVERRWYGVSNGYQQVGTLGCGPL